VPGSEFLIVPSYPYTHLPSSPTPPLALRDRSTIPSISPSLSPSMNLTISTNTTLITVDEYRSINLPMSIQKPVCLHRQITINRCAYPSQRIRQPPSTHSPISINKSINKSAYLHKHAAHLSLHARMFPSCRRSCPHQHTSINMPAYRDASLIRKRLLLGLYSRLMPRVLRGS